VPEFIVHSVPGSPYGRAVLATLEEKAAPYRLSPVAPGALRSEPHVTRHPFGKVPVLEHGDFILYETQAILRYLDRILPSPPLTPADPRVAARMDQLLNVNDCYLFREVATVITFQRVVGPRLLGMAPDEAAIAAVMPRAHVVFDALAGFLGEQTFFTGESPSLADLLLACDVDFFAGIPEWAPLVGSRANLCAWHARMVGRPSLRATTWAAVAERVEAA
jgi:glutathione S-transferase